MKDNWLKDLQGKLADYEREAPDMLWENIEKQLQSPRHKRNAHVWTWRKYVAAAILLLLICSSYFLISQTDIDMSVDTTLPTLAHPTLTLKSFPNLLPHMREAKELLWNNIINHVIRTTP